MPGTCANEFPGQFLKSIYGGSIERQKLVLATLLILLSIANVACGGKLEGTYSNVAGNVMLELRSGGKAALTLNGETQNCGWKSDSKKVTVTCSGDSMDFGIHDDGSLTGPTMVGVMRKSKS